MYKQLDILKFEGEVDMERKYSIDILRIISALAVIIIHIVSAPIVNSAVELDVSLVTNLNLIHNLMNWSVPVFFMITGYCLLKKKECTYEYCFSHVLKYVSVLLTLGLFYSLLEEIYVSKTINISIFIQSVINVIKGNSWGHMWFVYTIIGIYLVMPVIHHFLQQGKQNIFILTALLFVFNILLPTVEKWISIGIVFPFSGYLFYVCFGGAVAKLKINKKLSYFIHLTGLLSVIWIIWGADNHNFGYNHLAVCLIAMSIFLVISKIDIKPNKLLICSSKCTWGIYLIHPFFINIAIKLLNIDFVTSRPYIKLFAFAVIVSCASFLTTYILGKIPFVKKLF